MLPKAARTTSIWHCIDLSDLNLDSKVLNIDDVITTYMYMYNAKGLLVFIYVDITSDTDYLDFYSF